MLAVGDALVYFLVGASMLSALLTCVVVLGDAWAGRDPWGDPPGVVVFPAVVDPDGVELPPAAVLPGGVG